MAGWLIPALKAVLPHVGDIVAAAKPAFTRMKGEPPQAAGALVEQQIAELQAAASQNSAHIKELSAQLQARSRRALIFCALAAAVSFAALGVALFALLARPAVAQQAAKPNAKPNAILLVAKPGLPDANFRETVVLVTQAPDQHTLGVILNRPTQRKVDKSGEPFYFGGPVMSQAMVALFRAERAPEAAFHVLKGIYLSMHPADVDPQKVRRGQRYRLYLGFSGWAPGQLENEMGRDSWYVLPASEELLFRADTGGMWRELVDKAQKRKAPHARGLKPVADATSRSGRFSVSFVTVHG